MSRLIPKIIHYCWFGNNNLPREARKCIESWKKFLPDYQIIEWNEKNFDLNNAPSYVRQAYNVKKYAFVSDYVRMKALSEYGGLYFDTDLEVIKPFEEYLIDVSLVLAFESKEMLMTAFIACEKDHPFINEFLTIYHSRDFILKDGSFDETPNTDLWSIQADNWGVDLSRNVFQSLDVGIKVYPIDVFCGFDIENFHESIKDNTKTVHHMAFSWADQKSRRRKLVIHTIQKLIGYKLYDYLRFIIKKLQG